MLKSSLGALSLVLLMVAAPCQVGVTLAQGTSGGYNVQKIVTFTDPMYLGYLQAIGNWNLPNFGESGSVNLNFNNTTFTGVSSINLGLGSFRNQGSVAFLNIKPDEMVVPTRQLGLMSVDNNRVMVKDYNYRASVNFNNFNGSGVLVVNVMAASFSNQFTAVTVSMGKIPITPVSLPTLTVIPENPGLFSKTLNVVPGASVVALSNEQMDIIAGASNNVFVYQGKQKASASVEGASKFAGISAVTVTAGMNNQVSHTVQANFHMGQ
jgi:hypothetical protein